MSTPYYEDDFVTLYHGDCREVTAWLEADVLVTDPPYGIAWKQGARQFKKDGRTCNTPQRTGIANDDSTTVRDIALTAFDNSRPAIVFGSPLLAPPPGTRQVVVWQKPPNSGVFGSVGGWRRDWEAIYLLGNWGTTPAARSGVVSTGGSVNEATPDHSHAKPTGLMEYLIATLPSGDVADPFAGSGSTLIAAKNLGRKAIGVEVEERYCEVIAQRLSQDTLFGGAA